jgi:hypothetical protein
MELRLKIWNDTDAQCPFEAWDCQPAVMSYFDRWTKDYSNGDIIATIRDYFTTKVIDEQKLALIEALSLDIAYEERQLELKEITQEEYDDEIITLIENEIYNIGEDLKLLSKLLDIAGIPNRQYTSRGYSQSDWSYVLIALTPKFFKDSGCDITNADGILDGTEKLYDAWAWGNVFGFTVEKKVEYKKVYKDGTEEDDFSWEHKDSCGGFYGSDFTKNGMLEYLPEELHEACKNFDYSNIEYS